ncbi:MAG: YcxB family protein [Ruminococcus sp.]|nr:YcxB family protein [Ruminococcus sp.]
MENIKLSKEYSLKSDILLEGCKAYQKKFVYPRAYILMAVFLALAANFVYGAIKAPDNHLAYLLIMVCLALAFREWYNPRRLRRSIIESFAESPGTVYRLEIGENALRISTVYEDEGEETELSESGEDDDGGEYEYEAPEATVLPVDDRLAIIEKERLFLIIQERSVYYIVPKSGFSGEELEIVRGAVKM